MRKLMLLLAAVLLHGCSCEDPDPMKDQFRDDPFGANPAYADGRAMRPLPAHVVPREHSRSRDPFHTGVANGDYVSTLPVPVTKELLDGGRHHFEIYCATCHGLRGDGNSFVAKNMKLRAPPSLLEHREHEGPAARALRVGDAPPWPEHRTEGESTAPPSPSTPTGQAGLAAPIAGAGRGPAAGLSTAGELAAGERDENDARSVKVGSQVDPDAIAEWELGQRPEWIWAGIPMPEFAPSGGSAVFGVGDVQAADAGVALPEAIAGGTNRAEREAIARSGTVPAATAGVGGVHPHFRPGFVFSVISQGYGLMPSYAPELTEQERWGVVAYLEVLRLSQRAPVAALPPELVSRVRAAEAAR